MDSTYEQLPLMEYLGQLRIPESLNCNEKQKINNIKFMI